MRYKIHFTYPNGDEDNVIIQADTIAKVKIKVTEFLASRKATYSFSEELNPKEE